MGSILCEPHTQATWSTDGGIRGRRQLLGKGGAKGWGVGGSKVWQEREVWESLSVSHADSFHLEPADLRKRTSVDDISWP